MGKIVLMSPNIKGNKKGINRVQPPHSLGLLGAGLEQQGHEVYIRDTAMKGYNNQVSLDDKRVLIGESEKDIKNYLSNINPDLLGISVVFSNLIDHAHVIAKIAKQVNPKTKVVIGGNHITNATSDYQYACLNKNSNMEERLKDLEDLNIDFGMRGECDQVFPELVYKILNNKDTSKVKGLICRDKSDYMINQKPEPISLENLVSEARDKMDLEGYFKIGYFHSIRSKSKRVLTIMASRGCPEKCSFCTTPNVWGRKMRWRDPQNIYKEIVEGIEKYNIGEVQFSDDSLTINKRNLERLCDLIKPLNIPWCTPNGIRVNSPRGKTQYELFKKMKESGCYQISFGCESGVQRVLDDILYKNLKLEQISPAIENAKKAGLRAHTFWIVGFPGETRKEMEKTIEFAAQTNAESYTVSILNPLPGTEISRQVYRENLWWDKNKIKDLIYTNSSIKVDGFDGPKEFEEWVSKKNTYLNSLLKEKDPELFKKIYKSDDDLFLKKQT